MKQQEDSQQQTELQLYEYILQKRNAEVDRWRSRGQAACLIHVVFKAIVIVMLYMKTVLGSMMEDYMMKELMFFFTVLDFWFTKNYTGRKLLGLTWSFSQDPLGSQRFKYQFRINEQYRNTTNIRIFWLIQILFIIFPGIYTFVVGLEYYNESNDVIEWLVIGFVIVMGGVNLLLFYKAGTYAARKKMELRRKLPINFMTKFGYNSLISYV